MDAVAASDGRRHLVLEGALLECGQHLVEVGEQEVGGAGELDVEAGVEHVGRGHALVDEARLGADDLGEVSEEGDDVVLGLALDLVDAGDVEGGVLGLGPDRFGGLFGDGAESGEGVRRMRLDLEPDLEPGLRLPDRGHFRAGIAGDHLTAPGRWAGGPKGRRRPKCFLRRDLTEQAGRNKRSGSRERGIAELSTGPDGRGWRRQPQILTVNHGSLTDRY
ncbi:hypothetical protein ABH987_004315 [Bradyrhizobium ottawaense]